MKSLVSFIKEANAIYSDDTYKKIMDFKNDEIVILGWLDEDGIAVPMTVRVRKHGKDIVFSNPDDDREMYTWQDFINSMDNQDNEMVAVAETEEDMQSICDEYNNIAEM